MTESASIARPTRYMTKRRGAVSLLFLMNGFFTGSWAPKIPEFAERLHLSESALGLMILTFGLGSIAAMPVTGIAIARFGSARVLKTVALSFLPMLLLITLVTSVPLAVIIMILFGSTMAMMDVSMNGNAVSVEKVEHRSIMSSCHAFWSLGGLIGAALGGMLIAAIGVFGHAIIATLIGGGLIAIAWKNVTPDAPETEARREKLRLPLTPLPWLIGIMALFSMIPEGAIMDWSALYLKDERMVAIAWSGFGFAAFELAMTAMRFAGDKVRDRFGAVSTLRFCAAMSVIGLLMIGLAPSVPLVILGFAIAGIGISNMIPIAFSAAGNLPGLAPGIGLSVTTTLGYSGILVAPSAIGFIAEHTGFAPVYAGLALLHVVVFALAPLARHADRG
ncbi:MFS transporter [Martelella alba]|nr:MFS transporter [Martelella alba]